MPTLNLGRVVDADPFDINISGLRVKALMGWPNDTKMQANYIVSVLANSIGVNDNKFRIASIDDQIKWSNSRIFYVRTFEEFGGFYQVADSPSLSELEKHIYDDAIGRWTTAGYILALIKRMHTNHGEYEASINKAVEILDGMPNDAPFKQTFRIPNNPRFIRDWWSDYKSVSHLCASFFDHFMWAMHEKKYIDRHRINRPADHLETLFQNNLWELLFLAQKYYDFGVAYELPRRKGELLLDPSTTWRVKHEPHERGFTTTTEPLDGPWLESVQSYRAPKRM